MSSVNGVVIYIDEEGINLGGSLVGSNLPNFSDIANLQKLKLFSVKVKINSSVSALGNNKLYLPVSFGNNVGFMFVNGKLYYLNEDYRISGNVLILDNPLLTIHPSDSVIVYGPANNYTNNAIEYFNVNMPAHYIDSDTMFSGKATIVLPEDLAFDSTRTPFNLSSTYIAIDNEILSPEIDYIYDTASKKFVFESSAGITSSKNVFIFYFNQRETIPFKLGEVLYRINLTATTNAQSTFTTSVTPIKNFARNSLVFYLRKFYDYNTNYMLYPNNLVLTSSGDLKPLITAGEKLDISIFRDLYVNDNINIINYYFTAFTTVINNELYSMNLPISLSAINNTKSLLFFRGLLAINNLFDNVTPNYDTYYNPIKAEWYRDSITNQIFWRAQARTGPWTVPPTSPLVPSVAFNDKLVWTAFLDNVSKNSIRIEYYRRTNTMLSINTTQNIKQGKCILFYNGQALFKEFTQFNIVGSNTLNSFLYTAPPSPFEDELVVLYFTDDSYASLWKFDGHVLSTNINAGQSINLVYPIKDIVDTFVFVNGLRIPNDEYEIVPGSNNKAIRMTNGLNMITGDKFMCVHT